MALGDPIWGPSFERVYLELTVELVRELVGLGWTCNRCGLVWQGHSLHPTAHGVACPLYLSASHAAEFLGAVADRQPSETRDTRVCPP